MRVLHVLAEKGLAGGENQLLAMLAHLQKSGVDSIVALNGDARLRPHVEGLGLETHEVKIRHNADFVAAARLRGLFRRLEPDLIHFADSRAHKVGALAGLWTSDLPPRIATRRMDYPLKPGPFRRWLYGRAVTAVVVISAAVRDVVLKLGIDPTNVHLIHEGVDTARLAELREPSRRRAAREQLGLGENDICGITTASLHVRKGHDVLVRALGAVQVPLGRRIVWIFAGEGPERGALEKTSSALPDSAVVRLPGAIMAVL